MTAPAARDGFDAQAYLAWEERQPEKHEYVRGEMGTDQNGAKIRRFGMLASVVWP